MSSSLVNLLRVSGVALEISIEVMLYFVLVICLKHKLLWIPVPWNLKFPLLLSLAWEVVCVFFLLAEKSRSQCFLPHRLVTDYFSVVCKMVLDTVF